MVNLIAYKLSLLKDIVFQTFGEMQRLVILSGEWFDCANEKQLEHGVSDSLQHVAPFECPGGRKACQNTALVLSVTSLNMKI